MARIIQVIPCPVNDVKLKLNLTDVAASHHQEWGVPPKGSTESPRHDNCPHALRQKDKKAIKKKKVAKMDSSIKTLVRFSLLVTAETLDNSVSQTLGMALNYNVPT